MNHRERFQCVLDGRVPDRTPVVCRLDLWYAAQRLRGDPGCVLRGRDLTTLQRDLGMGVSARAARVFTANLREPARYEQQRVGMELHERWHLPQGSLHRVSRYHGDDEAMGMRPHIVKYPVQSRQEFHLLMLLAEHLSYQRSDGEYEAYDQQIGGDGLPMVILGPSPAHDILLNWTGYEGGFLQLADDARVFEEAFEAWWRARGRMWPIVAASPAQLVMHGVNFDVSVTPPPFFERYLLPYLHAFNDQMHAAGKRVAFHGDGELQGLLDLIVACGFDVADCLACAPMTRCTLASIAERFGSRIVIWGGIPSTLLEDHVSDVKFREQLHMVRQTVRQDRLIVGLADQAMPESRYDRLVELASFFAPGPN